MHRKKQYSAINFIEIGSRMLMAGYEGEIEKIKIILKEIHTFAAPKGSNIEPLKQGNERLIVQKCFANIDIFLLYNKKSGKIF